MRIDLLLKRLCLVKTRSQGRRGCEAGFVKVDGRAVKPSQEIREGDTLEITHPNKIIVVEIKEIPPGQVSKRERERFVRIISETPMHRPGEGWNV